MMASPPASGRTLEESPGQVVRRRGVAGIDPDRALVRLDRALTLSK